MATQPDNEAAGRLSSIYGAHGLMDAQAVQIGAALPSLTGNWSMERHTSYDGDLTLLLAPSNEDDLSASFVVDGNMAGLNLSVLRGDVFQPCYCLGTVEELIAALRRLTRHEAMRMQVGVTLGIHRPAKWM